MKNELAQKLKNAGFSQVHLNKKTDFDGDKSCISYMPSLSELIEACGSSFTMHFTNPKYNTSAKWYAYDSNNVENDGFQSMGEGLTPEEAVANLWLELNKK